MNNHSHNSSNIEFKNPNSTPKNQKSCSIGQILAITIPIGLVALFCAIFLPIYLRNH